MRTDKLKNRFIDELDMDRFTLKAFDTKHSVTTFKVKKKSEYLIESLNKLYE